ncbi:unnamed protein product, partial [Amoebophrya sp. A25]
RVSVRSDIWKKYFSIFRDFVEEEEEIANIWQPEDPTILHLLDEADEKPLQTKTTGAKYSASHATDANTAPGATQDHKNANTDEDLDVSQIKVVVRDADVSKD